jgi:hypothetical protein
MLEAESKGCGDYPHRSAGTMADSLNILANLQRGQKPWRFAKTSEPLERKGFILILHHISKDLIG